MTSIREFWEHIVLRDIAGYMAPGALTLCAFALLVSLAAGRGWWDFSWVICTTLARYPWLLLAAVLLAYLAGHAQIAPIDVIEKGEPSWARGYVAHQFLNEDEMGRDYCEAASGALLAPAARHRYRALCASLGAGGHSGAEHEERVGVLWRLCDHYVMRRAPDMHALYMGKFNVLYVLFTNISVSTFFLALGIVGLALRSYQVPVLETLLGFLVVAATLLGASTIMLIERRGFASKEARTQTRRALPALGALAFFGLLLAWCAAPAPRCSVIAELAASGVGGLAGLSLLSAGVGGLVFWFVYRAKVYQERFVRDAFMIFYALNMVDAPARLEKTQGSGLPD